MNGEARIIAHCGTDLCGPRHDVSGRQDWRA